MGLKSVEFPLVMRDLSERVAKVHKVLGWDECSTWNLHFRGEKNKLGFFVWSFVNWGTIVEEQIRMVFPEAAEITFYPKQEDVPENHTDGVGSVYIEINF